MIRDVLIVEDHGLVRAGMRSLLHALEPDARISEAGTYDEALALIGTKSFDIVFLDLDLRAAKNGLDLLARIREQDLPLKVIMLSATDERDVVLQCIAAGASGYIAKSSEDESVFRRALATVFEDGIFLPASIVRQGAIAPVQTSCPSPRSLAELGLSPRLTEVLFYLCQGLPNKSIANRMGISEGTVRKNYVSDLLRIFNVARRTELIIEIARRGVRVPSPDSGDLCKVED